MNCGGSAGIKVYRAILMSHRSPGDRITTPITTTSSPNVRGRCTSFGMSTSSTSKKQVVVEVPQAVHATYIFGKPLDLKHWVWQFVKTTRHDIRLNRNNVAESLGFQCRVVHGKNKSEWLRNSNCVPASHPIPRRNRLPESQPTSAERKGRNITSRTDESVRAHSQYSRSGVASMSFC